MLVDVQVYMPTLRDALENKAIKKTLTVPKCLKVEKLCDFYAMDNLKQLELKNMKSLIEIDVLKRASNLEILELKEINTKIKAEAFDFLLDMPRLKQLDFQYIDFNKKRIEIMQKKWIDSGKQDILMDCMPREKRQKMMNLIHLSRTLM